jgi:cytochrome c
VPKYQGDVEKLKRFIGNPVKVNPGYPAMPNLGLKEEEIDAVARYLLEKVKGGG